LRALKESLEKKEEQKAEIRDRDFEGGFGGQEDLEDRYATTSGEH
jgi:ATPase inhibitor, mitochondrial